MTVWIKSGTVAVTNGSATVQGTGTGLYGKVAPGYAFVGPDARVYEVVAVNLAEQITLASPYLGATASGAAYAIYPTLGLAAQLVEAVQALITAQQAIEASEVVAANGDRQFYSAEGAVIAMLKNSGRLGLGAGNIDPKSLLSLRSINPSIDLVETDTQVVGETSRILRNGDSVWFQTYDGDTLISNDYRLQIGAAGAIEHEWRIGNQRALDIGPDRKVTAQAPVIIGAGMGSGNAYLEVGTGRSADGTAYIDLVSDASAYSDYGLRVFRSGGVNPDTIFYHRGTGNFRFETTEGADVRLRPNAVDAVVAKADGSVSFGHSVPQNRLDVRSGVSGVSMVYGRATGAAYASRVFQAWADRAGSPDFEFLRCVSNGGGTADVEARLTGNGDLTVDGAVSGGGLDYAEYKEWHPACLADLAELPELRGLSVVLAGDGYIRPATAEDPPFTIIGAISANAAVIGNSDIDRWKGKYLKDVFGAYLMEDYEAVSWEELRPTQDPETGEFGGEWVEFSYALDEVPEGVEVPEDAEYSWQKRRVLNPEFDPELEYVSRAERPEWALVGLVGFVRIQKGQPVGDRWLKDKDITEDVEEWYVRG